MKITTHKIVAAIFLLFAYWQYNDPDYYIWIPIYLMPALIAILYEYGRKHESLSLIISIGFIIGLISYVPHLLSWINDGSPSIVTSMKAESPYIEYIREFFGLLICGLTTFYYFYLSKKKGLKNKN